MSGNVIEYDKESFSFKLKNCPAQIKELEAFEKDLLFIVKFIKSRNINDKFQNLMKADIAKLKDSSKLFIRADKTTNRYELSPTEYKTLLKDNITKTYKKATPRLEDAINLEANHIGKGTRLDDKIECTAKNPAFIALKDHKANFRTSTSYRSLNPCKSRLGKISKLILEKANKYLAGPMEKLRCGYKLVWFDKK